ncbi:MAG: GGDEF domain-containing protein, partial [Proteobacteria bacterium]
MKQWIQKLIDQLDYDFNSVKGAGSPESDKSKTAKMKISDERATLLYIIDTYSKHLVEVENYPVRRVREAFDAFSKELLDADKDKLEDSLFRLRQFFVGYKTAEHA